MTNLIRLPKVMEKTGLSNSTLWRKIAEGTFPKQIKISARVSVWKEDDVDNWIEEQIKNSEVA